MLDSYQTTGTQDTGVVTLIRLAVIFIPAVLILSGPLGYDSLSLAAICSASCLGLAWSNWKKHSRLTIPTLEIVKSRSK